MTPTLTIYSVLNAFDSPRDRIQHNAVESWLRLPVATEVILFGESESGARAFAEGLGLPLLSLSRNDNGTPLLGPMLRDAEAAASGEVLCYVNADIVILPGFVRALELAMESYPRFLLSSRRWDLDLERELSFGEGWADWLKKEVRKRGKRHRPTGIDLFAYRGFRYGPAEPGFIFARRAWDQWMVWRALDVEVPFLDGNMMLVHQNHQQYRWHDRDATAHAEMMHNRSVASRATNGRRASFSHACYNRKRHAWERTAFGQKWEKAQKRRKR